MTRRLTFCLVAGLLGLLPATHAARPLMTDDARIADPGACQLESWTVRERQAHEIWALPACNPVDNLEITVGGMQRKTRDGETSQASVLQFKTLLRPLEVNDFGVGLAAGIIAPGLHTLHQGNAYVYVPVTRSWHDHAVLLHLNLGLSQALDTHRLRGTWGIAGEWAVSEHQALIVEAFGQEGMPAGFQLGLRHWLVKDRAQIDATLGSREGQLGSGRWFSIGLRLLSPPWLN